MQIFNYFRVTILKFRYKCSNNSNKTILKLKKMTKLFSIIAVAIIATTVVSCGPSAEEKAKMEEQAKLTADSIAAALSTSLESAMTEATAPVDSAAATTETAAPAAEAKH